MSRWIAVVLLSLITVGTCFAQEADTTVSPTQTFDQIVGSAIGQQVTRQFASGPVTVTFGQPVQPVRTAPVRRTNSSTPTRTVTAVPPVVNVTTPAQVTVKLDSLQLAAIQRANRFPYGWAFAFALLVGALVAYGFNRATQPQPAQVQNVHFPDRITVVGLDRLAEAVLRRGDALDCLTSRGSFSFTANGHSSKNEVMAPSTRTAYTSESAAGGRERTVNVRESVHAEATLPAPAPVTMALGSFGPHGTESGNGAVRTAPAGTTAS